MQNMLIGLSIAFFLIALAYSMVGFGGASSYLAILVLAGLPHQDVPPLALACNLIVTTSGFWHFYKAGHFDIKKVLPFIIFSIPMAYFGGRTPIHKEIFSLILGLALLAVAWRMTISERRFKKVKQVSRKKTWGFGLPVGAGLGFLSGVVGIGGGIFLSPVLLLLRWTTVKGAGACASFFILINSMAGFIGHLQKGSGYLYLLIPLGLAVFLGGQIGSRFGAYQIPNFKLERILAGLVFSASVKLLSDAI